MQLLHGSEALIVSILSTGHLEYTDLFTELADAEDFWGA